MEQLYKEYSGLIGERIDCSTSQLWHKRDWIPMTVIGVLLLITIVVSAWVIPSMRFSGVQDNIGSFKSLVSKDQKRSTELMNNIDHILKLPAFEGYGKYYRDRIELIRQRILQETLNKPTAKSIALLWEEAEEAYVVAQELLENNKFSSLDEASLSVLTLANTYRPKPSVPVNDSVINKIRARNDLIESLANAKKLEKPTERPLERAGLTFGKWQELYKVSQKTLNEAVKLRLEVAALENKIEARQEKARIRAEKAEIVKVAPIKAEKRTVRKTRAAPKRKAPRRSAEDQAICEALGSC